MILLILFNILFSQNNIIENTTNIRYSLDSHGLIGYDSIKGNLVYPKSSDNNFIYSISHLFYGINEVNADTIISSNHEKYMNNIQVGVDSDIDTNKFFIYESKYFELTSGLSKIGDYNWPLYKNSDKLPGLYENDNNKRNLENYITPFIQSDNDIFLVYHDKFENGNLEYQMRILNFTNMNYIIVEIKVINNLDVNLVNCFFSPILDPDIFKKNNEKVIYNNDNGKILNDMIVFYDNKAEVNYYLGFKYLQKAIQKDGNYIFAFENQLNNVSYSLLNSDDFYNFQLNELFELNKKEIVNSDVKAIAPIGPFDLNKNDTCVITYTLVISEPHFEKVDSDEVNMKNLIEDIDNIDAYYYNSLFDFTLSVHIKENNQELFIFDLDRNKFIDEKIPYKRGKYLILNKKGNKFVLKEKVLVE